MRGLPERKGAAPVPSALLDLVRNLPPVLSNQALTHSSWVKDRKESNERLEFLGDSVLGLAVASALYERYPEKEEGALARAKAFVVSRASCVEVARRLGLPGLVAAQAPATDEERVEAATTPSVVGNVLEALIGACYLTFGFDVTAPAVVRAFDEQIEYAVTAHVDHKTVLQELVAPLGVRPVYQLIEEQGPPHARVFTSEVSVEGRVLGRGMAHTVKESEQTAAKEALAVLQVERRGG